MEGIGAGKRRPEELQGQGGVLHPSAPGQRRHRQAEGERPLDGEGRVRSGRDPVAAARHEAGLRGRVRAEAPG